jgi:O-antigen ligase
MAAVLVLAVLSAFGGPWFVFGVAAVCATMRPDPGKWPGILLLCLAVAPLAALLPPWFSPPWEAALPEAPACVSPQPLALLVEWPRHLAGLAFLWWICGRSREGFVGDRQSAALCLASVVALALAAGRWESGAWRGQGAEIFQSVWGTRNQAGGYAAAALAGCAMKAVFSRRRRWLWVAAAAACAVPLVSLGSRGALGAAAVGCALGWLVPALRTRRVRQHWRPAAIFGMAGILIALAVWLVLPHAMLVGRFADAGISGADFRLAIQRDAWRLPAMFPLTGVGLGNFDGAFPFFREASASSARAFHPESDWLWLACESGLVAGALAWAVAAVLAGRLWDLADSRPGESAVGFAAAAAVFAHGILDVPAHCGPVFVLVCSLAGVGARGEAAKPGAGRIAGPLVAIGLVLASLLAMRWSLLARPEVIRPDQPIPDPAPDAIRLWLAVHPLDFEVIEVEVHRAIRADDDPLAARLMRRLFLAEPFSRQPPERALAAFVAQKDGRMAIIPAREILGRTPPEARADRLRSLLREADGLPDLRAAILALPPGTAACQAVRIAAMGAAATPADALVFVNLAARAEDPGTTPALVADALRPADDEVLARAERVRALAAAVAGVRARRLAAAGDFDAACRVAATSPGLAEAEILAAAPAPVQLAVQEIRAGNPARARAILHGAETRHGACPQLWYVLGCAEWKLGDPMRGWFAFEKYLGFEQGPPHGKR